MANKEPTEKQKILVDYILARIERFHNDGDNLIKEGLAEAGYAPGTSVYTAWKGVGKYVEEQLRDYGRRHAIEAYSRNVALMKSKKTQLSKVELAINDSFLDRFGFGKEKEQEAAAVPAGVIFIPAKKGQEINVKTVEEE